MRLLTHLETRHVPVFPPIEDTMPDGIELYKQFIDNLVGMKRSASYLVSKVKQGDVKAASPSPGIARLLGSLTEEQKQALAACLAHMSIMSIHDVLGLLYDGGYQLVKDGHVLPRLPFGNPPYYDFAMRLEGEGWDNSKPEGKN